MSERPPSRAARLDLVDEARQRPLARRAAARARTGPRAAARSRAPRGRSRRSSAARGPPASAAAPPASGGRQSLASICAQATSIAAASRADRAKTRRNPAVASNSMTRTARISNIGAVILPFVAFCAAVVLLWNHVVGWTDLGVLAVMYLAHRLRRHDRLPPAAHPPRLPDLQAGRVRASRSLGSMAVQGPVINWVADHRKHHAHTDEEGDPHCPHGHGDGVGGVAARPLARAHRLAVQRARARRAARRYAPDLMEDPGMRRHPQAFRVWSCCRARAPRRCSASPVTGRAGAARSTRPAVGRPRADLPAAPRHLVDQLRLPLLRHAALRAEDESRNVFWLALPSLRRGLAPQPPRLPALGDARPAPHGARPVRAGHRAGWSGSGWSGTSCASPRSARRSASPRPSRGSAGRPGAPAAVASARTG